MFKRLLSLALCFVILALSLASLLSCANSSSTTSVTTDEDDEWADNLPRDLKWDGKKKISFLVAEPQNGPNEHFSERSIWVDPQSADSVDQAIYKRNQKIENRLGLKIDLIDANISSILLDSGGVHVTSLQANSGDIDVLSAYQAGDIGLAAQGLVLNLNELDQYGADYIDITQPWWSTTYCKEMSYKDAMYWLIGDITLRYLSDTCCLFVNGDIYEKYLFSDYGSIYKIVDDGNWTMDLMTEMITTAYIDNGSVSDQVDKDDQIGFIIPGTPYDSLAVAAGVQWTTRDENGNIKITLNNSHTIKFVEKSIELHSAKGSLAFSVQEMYQKFASGTALFFMQRLGDAETYFREMDNYYVIPMPKYDKEQKNYIANIWDSASLIGIAKGTDDIQASAVLIEALAAESYRSVTPIYYDEALKYKYTRDDDAARMIDIIRKSLYIDFGYAWGYSLNSIHNFFRQNTNENISSSLKSNQRQWDRKLEKLLNKLDALSSSEE